MGVYVVVAELTQELFRRGEIIESFAHFVQQIRPRIEGPLLTEARYTRGDTQYDHQPDREKMCDPVLVRVVRRPGLAKDLESKDCSRAVTGVRTTRGGRQVKRRRVEAGAERTGGLPAGWMNGLL